MLRINGQKGFQLTFDNGWTISVQFGAGNYCEHQHDDFMEFFSLPKLERWESKDAEIAAFNSRDEWWDFDDNRVCAKGSYVKGYVTADELVKCIAIIAGIGKTGEWW